MKRRTSTNLPEAVTAFVAIIWLGMLLGVSFIATPVKFQAPSLSLPVALEIGRATFSLFSRIEWGVAILLLLSISACRHKTLSAALGTGLVAILIVQSFWLLPILDARIEAIISEMPIPDDWHHVLYIGIEITKTAILVWLSIHLLRQMTIVRPPADTSSTGKD